MYTVDLDNEIDVLIILPIEQKMGKMKMCQVPVWRKSDFSCCHPFYDCKSNKNLPLSQNDALLKVNVAQRHGISIAKVPVQS